jgi:anti-sigma-K factor RskA
MNAPTDDVHDAAAAYALDALDDLERARFEAHLARCESCRRDVEDFRRTAHVLGRAVAEPPPADLRDRVLSSIATVRQDSPRGPARASTPPRRRGFVAVVAAAAMVLLVAALGFVAVDARRGRDDAERVAAVFTAPDSRTVELAGTGGAGRVVWSESEQRAVLVLDDVEPVGEDRAYELWFVADDVPRPAGLFRPDDGRVVAVLEDLPAGADVVAITEEDAAGAEAPTGPILLQGTV